MGYEKGVFDNAGGATDINHAVLLVGYGVDEKTGEKFYRIRNSWGQGYGEAGKPTPSNVRPNPWQICV